MLKLILKTVSGSLGPYIIYACLAIVTLLMAMVGVQTWRIHSLQTQIAQAAANLYTCQVNTTTLKAAIKQANADVDAAKQAANEVQAKAATAAKRRLATPFVPTAPGADAFNHWLETHP